MQQYARIPATPFVVQFGWTVLMTAAGAGVTKGTMQLLLDSGAAASINDKNVVAPMCSHLAMRM
jgi:hypothetical protein